MSGENEGTPDPMVENSPDTEAAAETNYEQRFKDTQAAFTKSQQALKDMESVWEDEDALVARIAEKFPHLVTEPEADTDDSSDFVPGMAPPEEPDPRLEALDKRAAALEAAEAERQYQADLNKLLGDREVDQTGRKFIRAACALGGDNYKALESAVSEFLGLVGESSGSGSAPKKNRAPAVIPNGQAVLGDVPDYDNMSQSERWDAMAARARALNNQS